MAIFAFDVPFPAIVLAAGLVGFVAGRAGSPAFLGGGAPRRGQRGPRRRRLGARRRHAGARPRRGAAGRSGSAARSSLLWILPVAALALALGPDQVFARLALFFSQMAVVTFGGAYAVLAYVAQQAVEHYGWLAPGEMLDGLGMAETTPGPLIMVVQFVGFLAAFRSPGGLDPWVAAVLGATPRHLGDLRAVVPLDLPRRALHRAAARATGRSAGRWPRSPRRWSG